MAYQFLCRHCLELRTGCCGTTCNLNDNPVDETQKACIDFILAPEADDRDEPVLLTFHGPHTQRLIERIYAEEEREATTTVGRDRNGRRVVRIVCAKQDEDYFQSIIKDITVQ